MFRGLFSVFANNVLLLDKDAVTGRTALQVAIVCERVEMAAIIVARSLSASYMLRLRDAAGDSAFDLAVWKRSMHIVQLLLAARVEIEGAPFGQRGWTPLHIAAYLDDEQIVRVISASMTSVALQDCVSAITGDSPLHVAARRNAFKTAGVLLGFGAPLHLRNVNLLTPLHVACLHGATATVQLLSSAAARLNALNLCSENGNTSLHYAARAGDTSSCRALVMAGALVNTLNTSGETAAFLAARELHAETVAFFLNEADAIFDGTVGSSDIAALHVASAANQCDAVAALIPQHGTTDESEILVELFGNDASRSVPRAYGAEKMSERLTAPAGSAILEAVPDQSNVLVPPLLTAGYMPTSAV